MSRLDRLPLLTIYLSERCNSRCVTCDYWRHGRRDMNLEAVERLLPALDELQTRAVLISGGEPLLNPQWFQITQLLKSRGLGLWLVTSGLSLAKHVRRVASVFESVTVSLDGTCRETYAAIRGVNAFGVVCSGIEAAVQAGVPVSVRITLQRSNFREMPRFVTLARELGARQISFLPVDVANPHAFGRVDGAIPDVALSAEDLPVFDQVLASLLRDHAEDFANGFIAESPQKLRRILQYFGAVRGLNAFPPVRCNAPEFSAVIDAEGGIRPCFFIPGLAGEQGGDLAGALNRDGMQKLRASIRAGEQRQCATCVCPLWRNPQELHSLTMVAA